MHRLPNQSKAYHSIYERVWDEADYVIPPSETNAFFVMTNLVITPNQTRSKCPEDPFEIPQMICNNNKSTNESSYNEVNSDTCIKGRIFNHNSHGKETGKCVKSDKAKNKNLSTCEIIGWCPVELDVLPMVDRPLLQETQDFTVLIKNSVSFPWFDKHNYRRDNMPNGICMFQPSNESTWLCPIFRLGDMVKLAGGLGYNQIFRIFKMQFLVAKDLK